MAFEFYKIERINGKYVLKKNLEQYLEVDAINKFNEIFNSELDRKLKLNKNIEQVIDYIIWKFSIKSGKFEYDFVPEWIEFIITDLIDLESNDVKKSIKKAINKHYTKEKNHYTRSDSFLSRKVKDDFL